MPEEKKVWERGLHVDVGLGLAACGCGGQSIFCGVAIYNALGTNAVSWTTTWMDRWPQEIRAAAVISDRRRRVSALECERERRPAKSQMTTNE